MFSAPWAGFFKLMNEMKATKLVLAVLGAGSVATSFLRQFAHHVGCEGGTAVDVILIFDSNAQAGAGNAYQDDTASNLLNTRATGMSALKSDPNHFYDWAMRNESRWRAKFPSVCMKPDAFVPRALFGQYMNEVYDESVSMLRELGVTVKRIEALATCLRKLDDRYEVTDEYGHKFLTDLTVLAVGNQESMQFDFLRSHAGYFPTPYPCTKLVQSIDATRSVGILGSNLSAIDAAVSLLDAGHRGKILMASRNGRLPSVRGEHNLTRSPMLLSRQRVAELAQERGGHLQLGEVADLLVRELEFHNGASIDWKEILRTGQGPQSYLDAEIEQASVRDRVWQAVVYGLNDAIDLIWHYLSDKDKIIFERDFKSQWLSYRVSFPIDNARKLQRLLHTDQLSVYGGCAEVYFSDALNQFAINVRDSGKSFCASLYTDYLINATGYTTQVSQCRSQLLRSLVASGQARNHKFGGIDVDFNTSLVLTYSGKRHEGLFALGSMVSGTYFWTNAMNVNCRLADGVARQIVQRTKSLSKVRSTQISPISTLKRSGQAPAVL